MTEDEINRAVAEKVMGLRHKGISFRGTPYFTQRDGECILLPDYCNSWGAMGEVMEKLKMFEPELGWSDEFHTWHCVFWKAKPDSNASTESAPKAVALAALKAKGIEC